MDKPFSSGSNKNNNVIYYCGMVAEDNAIHFRPGTGDFLAENNINGNNSYHYNYLSLFVYLGYVERMKNLLFSLSLSTLKEVAERYSVKVPKPLCAGFPD